MIINVPTNLTSDEILWEGELEQIDETYRGAPELARIAFGKIKWWSAADALQSQTGQNWSKPVGDRNYTLIRLSCTLYQPHTRHDRYQEVKLYSSLNTFATHMS